MPDPVVIVNGKGEFLAVNNKVEEKTGFSRQELLGKNFLRTGIVTAKSKAILVKNLTKRMFGMDVQPYEIEVLSKDGRKILVEVNARKIEYKGKPADLVVFRDVTERKKSERLYKSIVEMSPESIITVDLKGVITSCNSAATRMLGLSKDEMVGKHFSTIGAIRTRDLPKYLDLFISVLKGRIAEPLELTFQRKDGTPFLSEVRVSLLRERSKIVGLQAISIDVTERKRFEESLSALNIYSQNLNMAENIEEIYRLTLDAMEKTLGFEHASFMIKDKDMLWVADQRGYPESLSIKLPLSDERGITAKAAKTGRTILITDTKMEKAYVEGMPDIRSELAVPSKIGHKVLGVLNVESKKLNAFDEKDQKLLEILASHAATAISNLEYAKNLEKLVQARTKELRETQERLLKTEKLAAIGEVAAMVGHDLRNPLQSIENAAYYLNDELSNLPVSQRTAEMLEVLNDSVDYADKVIRDLQDFSATKKPIPVKIDVNVVVKEILSQVELSENVELISEFGCVPIIEADKDMMKRIFMNLVINGVQAMKEKGGTLKVVTRRATDSVEVSFKDTGVGISTESMEKIFSPFFTTKSRGMGMGLPICKKFVDAHGGSIKVKSEKGKGSIVIVKLPIQSVNGGEKIDKE